MATSLSSRTLSYILLASFLSLALMIPLAAPSMASTQSSSSSGGIIIPLYSYPGSAWGTIITQKAAHPSVPITVIVNPDSGPGASKDPNYATWISKLDAAGVTVIGYVHTSYGARSAATVESEISTYKSWYQVTGIFLDEMANVPGYESYYSSLTSYAHSLGFSLVVANPGAAVPSSYVGTADVIVIYESAGVPSASTLAARTMGLAKSGFATMSYAVSSLTAPALGGVPAIRRVCLRHR